MVLYPIVYVISSSFSSPRAVSSGWVKLWPVEPSLEGYKAVFRNKRIGSSYINTVLYTSTGTLINIAMAMIGAYPLARNTLPGRNKLTFLFTFTMYFGGGIVPFYSAMNLSPEFYDEFVAPYDRRLLKRYGGTVHFCGRGDHFIDHVNHIDGLYGINMSQPHLNNMEKIFAETIDKGLHLSLSAKPFDVNGHKIENLVFLDGE